ncbi:MAG: TrkA family potassium uptake protein [Gammaproteobacteria bacterium]|nr:TrkA family potassium uptake protein [Gammaproteobacteria bacterium]
MRDHYLVVGGGATGRAIVQELCTHGYQVVVVDSSDKGEQLPEGVFFVEGDATHDEVLHRANIDRCRGLFVALPSGKDNLYLTVTARMMRPDLAIIAKAKDDVIAEKLRRAGATGVVSPQVIGGLRMASVMIRPDVVDFLDQMLRAKNRTLRVAQVCVGEKSSLKGITVRESDLRSRFNLLILAIKKEDGHFEFNPRADHLVRAGDTLIVLGDIDQVGACQEWAV